MDGWREREGFEIIEIIEIIEISNTSEWYPKFESNDTSYTRL